jgi:hypothetical protein
MGLASRIITLEVSHNGFNLSIKRKALEIIASSNALPNQGLGRKNINWRAKTTDAVTI